MNVNDDACRYSYGNYGDKNECSSGFAVHGYCGSGRYKDCNKHSTAIKCCPYEVVEDEPVPDEPKTTPAPGPGPLYDDYDLE